MTNKHDRKVQQCVEDILEEHNDLLNHMEILINSATNRTKRLSPKSPQSEKKAVLTFLRKISLAFSELNQTALRCIEEVNELGSNGNQLQNVIQESDSSTRELCDYMKGSPPLMNFSRDFSTEGPKIPNTEVLNESYVRKPLDNVTLKAICTTIINNHTTNTQTKSPENKTVKKSPCSSLVSAEESDVFSTVSSHTFVHPFTKLETPIAIPQQYNTSELDAVKENLLYISRKMGFDSEQLSESAKQYDKSAGNEEKQGQLATTDLPNTNKVYMCDLRFNSSPQKLNNESSVKESDSAKTETSILLPNKNADEDFVQTNQLATGIVCDSNSEGKMLDSDSQKLNDSYVKETDNCTFKTRRSELSFSTGAIPKQTDTNQKLFECTSPNSLCSDKVTAWLNHESPKKELMLSSSSTDSERTNSTFLKPISFIQALNECPRTDRNELVRERALAEMPDLKFVSVPNEPKVIVNDLSSDRSSNGKDTTKKNRKHSNHMENLEIKSVETIDLHSICVFSHIESPAEFYLQIVKPENTTYLDLISTTLKRKFNESLSPFNSKQEAFERLGKFCYGCIWKINDSWFRMQILDWKLASSKDEVDVQLIDYGLKCTTSYVHLRPLTSDFIDIPKLAIKCHLALLYPPGSTYLNRLTNWPPSVTDFLYDMANLSRNLMDYTEITLPNNIGFFELVFSQSEGDSIAVDLVNFVAKNASTLGEMLIDMQLAVEIIDEYEQHPELGGFLSDIDELEQPENLNEFVLGYDARDELRICRFTRPDGSCFKGKHCKLEHISLKDGYTTDKIPVFSSAINDLVWPCKGEELKVLITGYLDSCTYLVQLIRDPVFKENLNVEMDREISDLMDAMNHTKVANKLECFKVGPALGEIILALHPLGKQWMRVAVRQINPNDNADTYEVYSVDFGDQFVVPFKNIRVMKEEFMHVPFQVVKVYLGNYQHKKECDKNKARKFFEMNMCLKSFLVKFESDDPPYRIRLTTLNNRDIGPTLMKHGFAVPRRFDCYITESENRILNNGLKTALE